MLTLGLLVTSLKQYQVPASLAQSDPCPGLGVMMPAAYRARILHCFENNVTILSSNCKH